MDMELWYKDTKIQRYRDTEMSFIRKVDSVSMFWEFLAAGGTLSHQNRKSLRLELRMSLMFCSAMVRTFSLGMRPSSRAIIS